MSKINKIYLFLKKHKIVIFIIIYYVFIFFNPIELKAENEFANLFYQVAFTVLIFTLPWLIIRIVDYDRFRKDIHYYFLSNAILLKIVKKQSSQMPKDERTLEDKEMLCLSEYSQFLMDETQHIAEKYNFIFKI